MSAPFRRVGEETVYQGYVMEVTVATFEDADGATFTRDTLHHPGAVAVIPVHDDGTVTLVRQFRTALLADLVEIPAGLRDVADEPVEAVAARELVEEVGLEAGTLEFLTAFHNAPGYADEVVHLFKATDLRAVPRDVQGPEEAAMTIERHPLADLVAMVERGEITDAKTIIAILLVAAGMTDGPAPAPAPPEIDEYLTWLRLERGRANSTIEAYRRDLTAWVAFLRARRCAITDVTEDDLLAWVEQLQGSESSRSTVKRRIVAARNLHRFLAEEGVVAVDAGAEVTPPSVARGLPKALSEAEVLRLLDAVVGDDPVARRDRAILETLYGTGIRISELVGMSLRDVDLFEGFMRVIGKGDKERVVPVLGAANDALRSWIDVDGRGALIPKRWRSRDDENAVFLNQRGGRLGRQGTWLVVRHHGTQAGLDGRLTPHVLRHSCATHLLDHGADIRAVQELLGHASIGTTQVYTRISDERLVTAWRHAHPRA